MIPVSSVVEGKQDTRNICNYSHEEESGFFVFRQMKILFQRVGVKVIDSRH